MLLSHAPLAGPRCSTLLLSASSLRRSISSSPFSRSHSNPLGLPTNRPSNAPPTMPRMGGAPKKARIPGVKRVVVVASGKGGVGKSTVAANLALSLRLARPSARVGLLDLDVFGPSVPRLMGLEGLGEAELTAGGRLVPMSNHGIETMSMGYLVPHSATGENPIVWRGIMVMKAVQQLLFDVDWTSSASSKDGARGADLDYLVVDMPPGTGDVALSLGQLVLVDAAVIVSTPQDVALIDARKGVGMFRKMSIPIHGLLLNMAHILGATPSSPRMHPFGPSTKFYAAADELRVPVLGELPLVPSVSEGGDAGRPITLGAAEGEEGAEGHGGDLGADQVRRTMRRVAEGLVAKLELEGAGGQSIS